MMKSFIKIKDFIIINKHSLIGLLCVIIISIVIRLESMNRMGRTWDEREYLEQGYGMAELIKKGDFGNNYFYTTYNHPPLVKYFYGITAHFDLASNSDNDPVFNYNLTYSRILSAIMFSVGILITVLIGWKVFSPTVGIISGVILSMLPFSLGLSQLVTAESFKIFIYPIAVLSYMSLINKCSFKNILFAGIATGIALQVKQSNFLLILLLAVMLFSRSKNEILKMKEVFIGNRVFILLLLIGISLVTFILLWPQFVFHTSEVYDIHKKLWNVQFSSKLWQITLSPPEVFFGRLMLTPVFYYVVYFFISIPIGLLLVFFIGVRKIQLLKNKNLYFIVLWFLLPFALSFYSWRQHGLRYIIEIYPAFSIIAAVGFSVIVEKFRLKFFKILAVFILFFYLLNTLLQIRPYYLDYFNELVGGVNNVYEKKIFQIGWWGQGVGEAGKFIEKNAPKGSRIGLAISPEHVFPNIKDLKISRYHRDSSYDYIVVNYYNVLREGFDDLEIKKNYKLAYEILADKAVLVSVYSK